MNLPNQDQREQREDQGYRVIFGMLDDDCIRRLSAAIDGILVRGADVDAGSRVAGLRAAQPSRFRRRPSQAMPDG